MVTLAEKLVRVGMPAQQAAALARVDPGVTSTGSTTNRAFSDRFAEVANVLDYFIAGEANFNNAVTRALATGKPIEFPYNGGAEYILTATFAVPSNTTIRSSGRRANIKTAGNSQRLFNLIGVSNVTIQDLVINGDKGSKGGSNRAIQLTNATGCMIQNVKLYNSTQSVKIDGASFENTIADCEFTSIDMHGVWLDGSTNYQNKVTNNLLQCGGFGIYLGAGTYKNEITRNRCYSNGLELIGVTLECWGNRVIGNHAEGTGDNGISITGFSNVVVGNYCRGNANNGICLYGHSNVATGNVCSNNAQSFLSNGLSFAGIHINPAWGGQGRDNTVTGNVCYDDQAVPTQAWGVRVGTDSYVAWAQGVTVASMGSNTYRYNGTNVYRVASTNVGTTTGANPPVHTSGIVNDGGVDWEFLYSATVAGNLNGFRNATSGNTAYGNRLGDDLDATSNANIGVRRGVVNIPVGAASNVFARIHVFNGSPSANVNGSAGDLMLRSGGSTGITAYLKESGINDMAGWAAIVTRKQGTTANRPSLGAGYEGYTYFDTTLGKPIWFKNPSWIDATGTAV